MTTAKVYRPQMDWAGSPVGGDGLLGVVTGVIMGRGNPHKTSFEGVVSTEGMIGIPKVQASGITVEQFDRLEIDDVRYAVTGPRQWGHSHSSSGTTTLSSRYWVAVEADHGGLQPAGP